MKKIQIYLTIFSIFILFLSNYALATTITVDGFPDAGWANTDVARSPDKDTDAPSADDNANIIDNYITDNVSQLFLRFDVKGEILGGPTTNIHYEYYAYIDADNNPATGSTDPWYSPIGSDYYIYISGGNHAFQDKQLYKWNGTAWALTSATVTAAVGCHACAEKNVLEVGVNLSDIGSPSCKMAFAFSAIEGTNWGGDFNNDANADGIPYTVSNCPGKSMDGMIDDWDGSELTALDTCETCIPDTVNMRQVGITSDGQNLYVRTTLQDTAFWGLGYKEYRIWIDVDPANANGYQPYLNTTPECIGNPLCIAWPNFYADYHITVATDTGGTIEETISQKLFLDCSVNDCSKTSSFIPLNGNKFESATGWKYIEFKIPLTNIPNFDPECFQLAFTTYDKNSLNICDPPGDNLPDWGLEGIGNKSGCIPPTTTTTITTTTTTITTTTTTPPTAIGLSTFLAIPVNNKVTITWETASEIDNAGFNIYRSASENGEYIKINNPIITAKGSSTQGASYNFVDNAVQNRKTYYYKLEDIDLNGTATMHGPKSATPRWIYAIW